MGAGQSTEMPKYHRAIREVLYSSIQLIKMDRTIPLRPEFYNYERSYSSLFIGLKVMG